MTKYTKLQSLLLSPTATSYGLQEGISLEGRRLHVRPTGTVPPLIHFASYGHRPFAEKVFRFKFNFCKVYKAMSFRSFRTHAQFRVFWVEGSRGRV